jgi:hypothetical protein
MRGRSKKQQATGNRPVRRISNIGSSNTGILGFPCSSLVSCLEIRREKKISTSRVQGTDTSINLYIFKKKSQFFACDVRALGNQPMLVRTRQRVKYLCLFVLLVHASNSVRNRTKLHCCALLSPHESPWAKLFHFGDASLF